MAEPVRGGPGAAAARLGTGFPWGTFAVNVTGSFAIGATMAAIGHWLGGSAEWRVFLVTGILGGFTTFSAYSFETLQLLERKAFASAFLYAGGSVVLSLVAVWLGYAVVRMFAQ